MRRERDVVAVLAEGTPSTSLRSELERVEGVREVVVAAVEEQTDGGQAPACVVAPTNGSLATVEAATERYPEAPVVAVLTAEGSVSPPSALAAGAADVVRGEGALLRRRVADAIERRRLEREVRGLLADPTAAVCLLAPDGTVERANDVARDSVSGDLVGLPFIALPWCRRASRDGSAFEAAVERARAGERVRLETTVEGRQAPDAEVVLRALGGPSPGAPAGVVATIRDVTAAASHVGEPPLLRTIVENVPVVLFAFDDDGEFLLSQGRGLERVGLDPGEAVGESVFDVYAGAEDVLEQCRRALDGEHVRGVVEVEEVAFETWYHPVTADGEVTTVIGAALDVTELETQKRELARQNERLEEFASIVSHDLRNPLNVARGGVDLLAEGPDDADVERVRNALDRIAAIVDDVLALARTGAAVEDLERVSLAAVARGAWSTVRAPAASLAVEADATLRADRDRLRRLLENLFDNAVCHGGEAVSIRVGTTQDGFYVADDGVGIPASDRDEVFESGYTTARTGTGFGLAIVREIVVAHDWSVSVGTSEWDGARFDVAGVAFPER